MNTSHEIFVMISDTAKRLWLLDTLCFKQSALDHQQSGFWMCSKFL